MFHDNFLQTPEMWPYLTLVTPEIRPWPYPGTQIRIYRFGQLVPEPFAVAAVAPVTFSHANRRQSENEILRYVLVAAFEN